MSWLQERQSVDNDQLHTLYRILGEGSFSQIDRTVDASSCDRVKDRLVLHAADRERNTAEVELSGENAAAELLHDVLHRGTVPSDHRCIVQGETSVLVSVRVPVVVVQVFNRPRSQHQRVKRI